MKLLLYIEWNTMEGGWSILIMRAIVQFLITILILIILPFETAAQDRTMEIKGQVTKVDNDLITIDLRQLNNIRQGMRGVVYNVINEIDNPIRHFKVISVDIKTSQARMENYVEGREGIMITANHLVKITIPEGNGTLVVSNPSGANVYLNEESIGNTPVIKPSGIYIIRAEKRFYKPVNYPFIILPNGTSNLDITLERGRGRVCVNVKPSDANIKIGEQEIKSGQEIEMDAGDYKILIKREGYYPKELIVTVEDGKPTNVDVNLDKYAVLKIDVIVDGKVMDKDVFVSIDGGEEKSPPFEFAGLPMGEHTINARTSYMDFDPKTEKVTLEAGKTIPIKLELPRKIVELDIETIPPGVEVTAVKDGKSVSLGKTNLGKVRITTGKYVFRFSLKDYELEGYENNEMSIKIGSEMTYIKQTLIRSKGSVIIESKPEGAEIYIVDNPNPLGITDTKVTLDTGDYPVILKKEGYPDTDLKLIRIQRGENKPVTIELPPPYPIKVSIISEPPGAFIVANSKLLDGKITPIDLELPPGKYPFKLKKGDDYYEAEETIVLAFDAKKTIKNIPLRMKTILSVESRPMNIMVDLEKLGTYQIPAKLREIAPGDYIAKTYKIKGFKDYYQPFKVEPNKLNNLNIVLRPKRRIEMVIRSVLIPGWGQRYGDRSRSSKIFFAAGSISALGMPVAYLSLYKKPLDDYNNSVKKYNDSFFLDEIKKNRDAMNKTKSDKDIKHDLWIGIITAAEIVWSANLIHVLLVGPYKETSLSANAQVAPYKETDLYITMYRGCIILACKF